MQQFEELEKLISAAKEDAFKFFNKGNASAGTRLRKAMQDIKAKAQDVRNEVTNQKNSQS